MKIIGTGLSGLVGSRIQELLKDHEFEDISRKTGTNITDKEAVLDRIKHSHADVVLHLAAKADVDGCELDKHLGEKGKAWQINVVGTEHVVAAVKATSKHLMYISTDFVFDGENPPIGGYTEDDEPHPINWYAQTKYEGEQRVLNEEIASTIVRIAYPYRASFEKNDFYRAIKSRLEIGQSIAGVIDHTFCPTFIDDLAFALDTLIKEKAKGIYHVTGSEKLSPYDAAVTIAEVFDLDKHLISETTRAEYFKNKAVRPFDLSMNNDRIRSLGVQMRGFRESLEEVRKQLDRSSS